MNSEVMSAANELDEMDRRLVDHLQGELPVIDQPFSVIGEVLGLPEVEVIERTRRLRESGLIRQISAIFDTRKLGYTSALVAAMLPVDRLEDGAAVVSAHPGVSHNYERDHPFNLWFTLAVPPGEDFDEELEDLSRGARFQKCRSLPALKVFRIGVRFSMSGESGGRRNHQNGRNSGELTPLSGLDQDVVRALQEDLPIVSRPYGQICNRLGFSIAGLAEWAQSMRAQGRLRRISAVLRHRQAGFKANAMVVWNVPRERIGEIGEFCADIDEVSHCYERPTFDDWPYALYTMIHGKKPSDCDRVIARIVDRFGYLDRAILYSTREFKKERVKYFV